MKKKLFLLALLAQMCVLTGMAAVQVTVDGLKFEADTEAKTAKVISNTGKSNGTKQASTYSGSVIIPASIAANGVTCRVTEIGEYAFYQCTGLTSVTIPRSVTMISQYAFYYCRSLTSVTIPDRVTSIGNGAFYDCDGLTSITIPGSVTNIGSYAFYGCSGLTNVTISEGVTSIGSYAFRGCNGLTNVTIPGSVTSIQSNAFESCSNLASIIISEGVSSIESAAFKNCSKLNEISISESVTFIAQGAFDGTLWLNNQSNGLIYAGLVAYQFKGTMANGIHITIKDGTKGISSSLFSGRTGLASISLPSELQVIGYSAFQGCSGLTSITFPDGVQVIESSVLSGCSNLTSVTLPAHLTEIKATAFYGCTSLPEVTIPASVTTIGSKAFQNCTYLENVYCLATTVPETDATAFDGCDLFFATLYVPASALEDYSMTEPWSGFETKEALGISSYTLTYIVDGETYKSYDVESGSEITPEAAPTREGYTFSGWSEIPATMPEYDVTVTGTFSVNSYTLTYVVDGETYKTYTVAYGSSITPEPAPQKEDFEFSGWSEIPATMPAHDVTITGSFANKQYTLTYMVDGETYKSYDVESGSEITPEAAPTKEGYTFSGWSEIPATMPDHDVTVTGTFTINQYKLTYKVDGVVYKFYELDYGTAIVPEAEPTKEGYLFSGWSEIPETMPAHNVTVNGNFYDPSVQKCAKPTITYEDGELVFTSTTPGATCISTITVDDAGTFVGNRRSLTATYIIKVYAMANGYEDSQVAIAQLCWMDDNSMPVNIEEVEMTEVKARPVLIQNQGSTLVINGVEADTPVSVYDLSGRLMGSGTAMDGTTRISTKLTSGQVAIVRMGERSVKVKIQ